jgi:hypothetical protein
MRQFYISLLLLMSLLCTVAYSDSGVTLGYVTGNDYMKMDENSKTNWLIGVMDGIMAEDLLSQSHSPSSDKKEKIKEPWLGRCIKGIPISHIKAMFEKELKDNPDGWHAPAALVFKKKFKQFCEKRA